MRTSLLLLAPFALAIPMVALSGAPAAAQGTTHHAVGDFEAKIAPVADDRPLSRLTIDKTFTGALQGSSKGEMLASGDGESDGAYVAIERVTGTLNGKAGGFDLVHRGLMQGGTPHLMVTIVPQSGTGELKGIAGDFAIVIDKAGHHYDLSYTLPGE